MLSKGEWRKDPRFHSLPGISDPPSCWVSIAGSPPISQFSDFVWETWSPAESCYQHSARHSGLRGYWLAPTSDLCLPSQSLALPLIGSVPLSLCGSFLIGAFLSISQVSSISLSLSLCLCFSPLVPKCLSLPICSSVCLHLCLSLPSSDGGWVRVGPGQPGQGAGRLGEQYPIHAGLRCHGNAPVPPSPPRPRVPRGCHGYVRRVPASPRALGRPRPAGGAQLQPLP